MSTSYTPGIMEKNLLREIGEKQRGLSENGIMSDLLNNVIPVLLHHGLISEANDPELGFVFRITQKGRETLTLRDAP
jgi:hypothetical protein